MAKMGTLEQIWRYPVKSLHWQSLTEIEVESDGLRGDRTGALFVRDGHARTGKTLRGKEHDELHLDDAASAVASAAARGITTDLCDDEGRYFDDAPISLLVDRWLDGLSAHLGYPVEPIRFRPNLFVCATTDFTDEEEALTGVTIAIGDVLLKVRKGIGRCVTTTYHPQGAAADPRVLRYVASERANLMGIYCDVLRTGVVRAGDSVLVER